jgi:hypothetical protein
MEAPDPAVQLERLSRFHSELVRYSVEIHIRVFSEDGGTPTQVLVARTARRGEVMLQELSSFVVLSRPELRLMVDRAARTVYVNPEAPLVPASLPSLDPAVALRAARAAGYTLTSRVDGDVIEIAFRPPDAHPTVIFALGRDEPRLRRMQLIRAKNARDGPARIEVDYRWGDLRSDRPELFEAAHYLQRRGATWTAAAGFRGFRVVDSHAR